MAFKGDDKGKRSNGTMTSKGSREEIFTKELAIKTEFIRGICDVPRVLVDLAACYHKIQARATKAW